MTEDEMIVWHHQLNGHGFEQNLGDSEGQGCVLQSKGSQRIRQDLVTQQQQKEFDGVKIKVKIQENEYQIVDCTVRTGTY